MLHRLQHKTILHLSSHVQVPYGVPLACNILQVHAFVPCRTTGVLGGPRTGKLSSRTMALLASLVTLVSSRNHFLKNIL